jgi:hypothetical protein
VFVGGTAFGATANAKDLTLSASSGFSKTKFTAEDSTTVSVVSKLLSTKLDKLFTP